MHREALFDLAVGSLFHEAMKLRENLYQREVYGPRVRALRSDAGEENEALFDEFEKMLGAVAQRLDEGLRESETLLAGPPSSSRGCSPNPRRRRRAAS